MFSPKDFEPYLDREAKISCIKALSFAKKHDLDSFEMAGLTKSFGIKINRCALGAFGKHLFGAADEDVVKELEHLENSQVDCTKLWQIAQKSSIAKVANAAHYLGIEVVNCRLGCFRYKKGLQCKSK